MREVDNLLQKYVADNKTPSVQYIIFDKNSIVHKFISGFADIQQQKKIHQASAYNAYSVTKTFTALAIMQLAQRKLIEIDRPVIKYFPGFPYPTDINIRQLLAHTAGIPNPIPLRWIHLKQEHLAFDRNKFFHQLFLRYNQVRSKPNEKFAYSNLGYVLLGQLIEKVSDMPYEQFINENILTKLELEPGELGFLLNDNGQHARGYHKRYSFSNSLLTFLIDKSKFMDKPEGKWRPFRDFYINGVSYGGLIGTPMAFVKYCQELLKPNCKLISDNYKEILFEENYTNNGKATGMCLSWFKGQLNGETYLAHAGGGGGYYCEIRIYPGKGIGSVVFFNRTGMSDERFLDKPDKFFI